MKIIVMLLMCISFSFMACRYSKPLLSHRNGALLQGYLPDSMCKGIAIFYTGLSIRSRNLNCYYSIIELFTLEGIPVKTIMYKGMPEIFDHFNPDRRSEKTIYFDSTGKRTSIEYYAFRKKRNTTHDRLVSVHKIVYFDAMGNKSIVNRKKKLPPENEK